MGIDLEYKNKKVEEKLATDYVDMRTVDFQAAIQYELQFENDLLLGCSRNFYAIESDNNHSSRLKPRYIGYFIESRNQKMDYRRMLQNGWQNKFKASYNFLTNGEHGVISFYNELKLFKAVHKMNFAGRFMGGFSNEETYFFQPYFIDNTTTIRGAGHRAERGNRMLVANLEYRYGLLEVKDFGLQMVGFLDVGHIVLKTNDSRVQHNVKYLGGGTRLVYIKGYDAMISIDYAINLDSPYNKQFIVSWGQYF